MPLSQLARRFADTKHNLRVEELAGEYQKKVSDIRYDHHKRGMIASGSYVTAVLRERLHQLEDNLSSRINSLVEAYQKSGFSLNDDIYAEIIAEAKDILAAQRMHIARGAIEVAKQSLHGNLPANFESSLIRESEHGCDVLFSKLDRGLIVQTCEEMLTSARKPSVETAPTEEPAARTLIKAGAVHDAFVEIRSILKLATLSLEIVDPYVDETLWQLLSTLPEGASIRILTKDMKNDFLLECDKYAQQFKATVEVRTTEAFHDRFLIIDNVHVYHLGASIKDAGKKVFLMSEISDARVSEAVKLEFDTHWRSSNVHR